MRARAAVPACGATTTMSRPFQDTVTLRHLMSQTREATTDALAGHELRAVQHLGDVGVFAFLDHPRPDRLALGLGELFDQLEDRLIGSGGELVDAREVVVVEHLGLEREPAAGAILDPAVSPALEHDLGFRSAKIGPPSVGAAGKTSRRPPRRRPRPPP